MPKTLFKTLKEHAIYLRTKERYSYLEISNKLKINKSTLNGWLKNYPLTQEELHKRGQGRNRIHCRKKREDDGKYWKILQKMQTTRQHIYRVSEAAIILRMAIYKLPIYNAVFDGEKIDFLTRVKKQYFSIQVKTTKINKNRPLNGLPVISLRCTEGHNKSKRYEYEDFDFIIGYDVRTDIAYIFSAEEVKNYKTGITITENSKEAWHKILNQ